MIKCLAQDDLHETKFGNETQLLAKVKGGLLRL